jgi:hypothetical protein
VSEISVSPISCVDIKPINFGQVSQEKQQVFAVSSFSDMFQQTSGIGNFTRWLHKEILGRIGNTIWRDESPNGPLTLVDDPRGRIETSGAIRIKEEVTQPMRNIVPQDMFVFDLFVSDMNQI